MVTSIRPSPSAHNRLLGLDALRGLAALSVLLYHYTTRFDQKHGHGEPLPFAFDSGFLGVNLFFAISGFVIFMTLDRIRAPRDFIVSRFSRLFPAFWAAVALTWCVEWAAQPLSDPLPAGQAMLNTLMLHGYFGVPSVDGVYWTLQVELFFYLGMFLLWLGGALRQPLWPIGLWLLASWSTWAAPMLVGRPVPHAVSEALLLPHFPYFALGIAVYLGLARDTRQPRSAALIAALALLSVWLADGTARAVWATGFALALVIGLHAGSRPRAWLSPMVWLGAISYPLYLLHQDIGYVSLQWLQAGGVGPLSAIALTTGLAVCLAALVHYLVEEPGMRWLRRRLRGSSGAAPAPRFGWLVGTAAFGACLLVGSVLAHRLAG